MSFRVLIEGEEPKVLASFDEAWEYAEGQGRGRNVVIAAQPDQTNMRQGHSHSANTRED